MAWWSVTWRLALGFVRGGEERRSRAWRRGVRPWAVSPVNPEIQLLVERRGPQQEPPPLDADAEANVDGSDVGVRGELHGERRSAGERGVTRGERGDCGYSSVPVIGGDFCVRRGGPPAGACVEDHRRRQTDTNQCRTKKKKYPRFVGDYSCTRTVQHHTGTHSKPARLPANNGGDDDATAWPARRATRAPRQAPCP